MKKKLQLEIKQLAKQLIALEGDFNTAEMKAEVTKLLEKLAVLEYFEGQVGGGTVDSGNESLDSKSFREEHWFKEPEPLPQSSHQDELVEPLMEKIKDLVAQMPAESHQVDELLEEVLPKKQYTKNALEEFASNYQETPTFERKNMDEPKNTVTFEVKNPSKGGEIPEASEKLVADLGISKKPNDEKPKSLNDTINNGLSIGLNDRLAFIKHLFNGNAEDYTRVLSQINTMQNFEEASQFITGTVKPDYNQWLDKDEFKERFMTLVEKRFN
jgi:hypothetical protein